MLHEIHGDLFTTTAPLIAHGVNCRGAFGAGVAGQIARRFPAARHAYLRKYDALGWRLGVVQVVADTTPMIANLATQDRYGSPKDPGQPFADLDAIRRAVGILLAACNRQVIDRIAMPRLGCGLGGLNWADVRPIIERLAAEYGIDVEVYSLEG